MLPVDVFHFKSKHKESDEFCQKHCNPAQWTELVGDDGEWIFNSSAAEQSNVWIETWFWLQSSDRRVKLLTVYLLIPVLCPYKFVVNYGPTLHSPVTLIIFNNYTSKYIPRTLSGSHLLGSGLRKAWEGIEQSDGMFSNILAHLLSLDSSLRSPSPTKIAASGAPVVVHLPQPQTQQCTAEQARTRYQSKGQPYAPQHRHSKIQCSRVGNDVRNWSKVAQPRWLVFAVWGAAEFWECRVILSSARKGSE
ncbi:hypothetical protein C8R42DRAFT_640253 [Lentinula raphanica]|nr:hypothetical protein C8R42DRAFT_640253 [Lentinula raphanica]